MGTQGGKEPDNWVRENHKDPNWNGLYVGNLVPGARFLYFALHELGLVDESVTRDKLVAVVHEVYMKHGLVAGDWEMLERCIELFREVAFIEHKNELRKAAQDGFDNDLPF